MGKRWLKSLKLNGVIVGDYMGSDDPDEDIEAARDVLRAKGIYEPPSVISAMLGQANAFAYTANRIYTDDIMKRSTGRPIGFAPFVVNAAFSVELYLKTLHTVAGASVRGHPLLPLFDALADTRRTELEAECVRLASEHGERPQVQFRDLLAVLNTAFEKWRYVYELPRSGAIHLQQTILIMHTCRDVCARAVSGEV
jgi:hypothetical protein